MQAFLLKKISPFVALCSLLLVLISEPISAQFLSATMGINGLTCSLCSYGVEREIYKLDFVEHVNMDLNQNIATVVFKKDKTVHIKDLVAAVYKAGFSVGYTQAVFSFDKVIVNEDLIFIFEGDEYHFLNTNTTDIKGEQIIRFIDKKYIVSKVFKKEWEQQIKLHDKQIPHSSTNTLYHITR